MRVLVACEFSGIVREAFAARGHEAYSCDLLGTEQPGDHWQGDAELLLNLGFTWDLLIAHPPCTHLANSGAKWFAQKRADGRMQQAIEFFMLFVNAEATRIAIENPVGVMSSVYRKPDQVIHPWQFGHEAEKPTCLWLKNLPPLVPTNIVARGVRIKYPSGKSIPAWYANLPPATRSKSRSQTFPGIAEAMAEQWGSL